MGAALIPFAYDDYLVRSVLREGEPWFIARDVCAALEIGNSRDAIARLDDDERADVAIADTSSNGTTQNRSFSIISEPGVYRLVFTSRKKEAERFKRWLAHEVLPALRRTGSYAMPGASVSAQRERAEVLDRLIRFDRENVPQPLASAVATMPVWGNRRQRRPNFWPDIEVRELLTAFHRQVTIDGVRAVCAAKFGAARTPSKSAVARYWLVLDKVRGIGPAPARAADTTH